MADAARPDAADHPADDPADHAADHLADHPADPGAGRARDDRPEHRGADVLAFPVVGRRGGSVDGRGERRHPAPREPKLREALGEVLRDERHRQQRTLADVAGRAAVSLPYLSEVERGAKEVSSDLLAAICGALELTVAEVLERSVPRLRPRAGGGAGGLALAA